MGRKYKRAKWADRLQTPEEKAKAAASAADAQRTMEEVQVAQAKRLAAAWSRGTGAIVGGNYMCSFYEPTSST